MKHPRNTVTVLLLALAFAPTAQAKSVAGRAPTPVLDSEGQPFVFNPESVGLGDEAAFRADFISKPKSPDETPPAEVDPNASVKGIPAYRSSWGISRQLYQKAVTYLQKHQSTFPNNRFVVMVDMRGTAAEKRFVLFDRQTSSVELHNTAHGTGSDPGNSGKAKYFSNKSDSRMTSLGVYKTGATFLWRNHPEGPTLRLQGLENTNSAAMARGILVHPANYVRDGGRSGRSWGCLALDPKIEKSVVAKIKGGAMLVVEK